MFRRTCGDYTRVLFYFAREAAGALTRPAFPAPSVFEGHEFRSARASFASREGGGVRHCERWRSLFRHGRACPGHPRLCLPRNTRRRGSPGIAVLRTAMPGDDERIEFVAYAPRNDGGGVD